MCRTSSYPPGWAELSYRLKSAAGWRCEGCGLAHGEWGWRDEAGGFHPVGRAVAPSYERPPFVVTVGGELRRVIEIVLAAAHLDHDRNNGAWDNLRAWCQQCHVRHDIDQHRRTAAATRRAAMATLELF